MTERRPTVLLTGFGPFPGVTANATAHLVPRLREAAARAFPGHRFVADVLPTEWQRGPDRLGVLLAMWRPAVALHFGVSSRAEGFTLELRARNAATLSTCDAVGHKPQHARLAFGGGDYLSTALPAAHIVERLRRRGLPAVVSRDAGAYLCNAILYNSLAIAGASAGAMVSGFVHLPSGLVSGRRGRLRPRPGCPLTWPALLDGSLEIVAACLGQPPRPRPLALRAQHARLRP